MVNERIVENLKQIALSPQHTSQEQMKAMDLLGDLGEKEALTEIAMKSRHNAEYALLTLRIKVLDAELRQSMVEP